MDLKTRDPNVVAVIGEKHENLHHIIKRDWVPNDLMSECALVLANDGMSEPLAVGSVLHAQLVVNFEMAQKWGWGFGDILSAVRGVNSIEQNEHTWITDVCQVLNSKFECNKPKINRDAITKSPLFKAFRDHVFRGLGHDLKPGGPHPTIKEWEQSVYRKDVDAIVSALIGQLETGRNALLDPASETQDDPTLSVKYRCAVQGPYIIVEVMFDGQRRDISALFQSAHHARAAEQNHDMKMALIWVMTANMDSEDGLRIIEGLPVEFSPETQKIQSSCDISTDDLAKLIFSTNGAEIAD